ncbi:MAG: thiamine pyrophosphate-binding protein [Polyangiaceae bacterium]|nr:thiamine pyrophosphate-binding protein [Polyangiaceae bacterium]
MFAAVEREGVEYVFGVPGSAITPLYESLRAKGTPKHILAKHEGGAAFMAGGYARVKGNLGVCMTTTGPGATNAITGVAAAMADSTPLLILTGQNATKGFGRSPLQDSTRLGADTVGLFSHATKLSVAIPSGERANDMIDRAVRCAMSGRPGPVHVSLPVDVQQQPVPPIRKRGTAYVRTFGPDPAALAEAARLIADAKQPAILAGHGVAISGAHAALLDLAVHFGIPVASTPKGKGVFPENHPLSLGVFGFGGQLRAEAYLLGTEVDVLVVVGTSLGELQTNNWDERLQPKHALIQIDIDPNEIGKNYPVDVGIVGDARLVLQKLVPRRRPGAKAKLPRERVGLKWGEPPPSTLNGKLDGILKPPRVVREMRAVMPDDGLLFVDNGNSIIWATHYFEARQPGTVFLSLGFASMGNGVAAAIGGQLAAPTRPVVALVGDAAFMMNGTEVHTAVEHNVPVVWVVLNNSGHGMVYHGERMLYGHDLGANKYQTRVDFAGMARAMGARGTVARTPREFRSALESALTQRVPTVIDAHVDPDDVPEPLVHRARAVARAIENQPISRRSPWTT